MPNFGESILSKVLDEGNILSLREYDVKRSDFATEDERKTYDFITNYAKDNGGKTPDYRTVVEHFPDFYYREGVSDEYRYLVRQLKSFTAKRRIVELIAGGHGKESLQQRVNAMDGNALIGDLLDDLMEIREETSVREKVGTDIKKDASWYLQEYRDRRDGKSIRIWRSKFNTINVEVGGYFSGNMYTWMGRSGRGKSVFVMEEIIEAAMQGATCLVWAMEMSRYEWMARAYASLSARTGIIKAELNGLTQSVGIQNREMLSGTLTPEMEQALEDFLLEIDEFMPGTIILRSADDTDFENRSVRQLESDIIRTGADVILLDAFYHMTYEKNTSKTAGGDAAETSKKVRALAGRTKTVIHVITQADEDGQQSDEERELSPPTRSSVKKTKAVLEDAVSLFAIDTVDGAGVIQIGKGRQGGEGTMVEVVYLPNYGIVREMNEELYAIAASFGLG